MRVEIDQTADAASIQWAPRARAESQVVGRPEGRGVRLYFDEAGDVVGLEVLGWSQRTASPAEVQVVVHPAPAGDLLPADDALSRELSQDAPDRARRTKQPASAR
jgi:hypothetical protein